VKLTCDGVRVEINRVHYWKLRALFERNNPPPGDRPPPGGSSEKIKWRNEKEEYKRKFEEATFCLLARYSSLQGTHYRGGGFQAAIHSECFDILRQDMGVLVECFASPLNCRWGRYCSAFMDTDAPFGSLGSFFALRPEQGSFEANPPFDDDVIFQMREHMERLLANAARKDKALSFVVIIPEQVDKKGWKSVASSKFLQHHLLLIAGKHGYKEGAQHNRSNTHRTSCHNTSIFFLQTAAGSMKWPTTKRMLQRLEAAFATKANPSKDTEHSMDKTRWKGGIEADTSGGSDSDSEEHPIVSPIYEHHHSDDNDDTSDDEDDGDASDDEENGSDLDSRVDSSHRTPCNDAEEEPSTDSASKEEGRRIQRGPTDILRKTTSMAAEHNKVPIRTKKGESQNNVRHGGTNKRKKGVASLQVSVKKRQHVAGR